ncbi:hypothetical protein IJ670_08605, partial [bacterium]|nr:hypothetical protein [bacterium]
MKIGINNSYNSKNFACYDTRRISFASNPADAFERHVGRKIITYFNADNLSKSIDKIYGSDGFFSNILQKANIDTSKNKINFQKQTFLKDVVNSIKYPFCYLPLDLLSAGINGLRKIHLNSIADKISQDEIVSAFLKKNERRKSLEVAYNILDEFSKISASHSLKEHVEPFQNITTSKITRLAKNYKSRDERTLNRIATATVSAIYSAKDFFNISLLENDDKKKANEAKKSRFKQEMTRMGMSAGLTFLSLNLFEKYTKGNIFLSSLVIAGSSLFSEIVSRLINKTPLVPLSPEQAAKFSKKQHKQQTEEHTKNLLNSTSFKKRMRANETFSEFNTKNGNLPCVEKLNQQNTTKPQKKKSKISAGQIIGIAFGLASLGFFAKKGLCGEYRAKIQRLNFYKANQESIKQLLKDPAAVSTDKSK